jgi:hypothetical protein
VIAPFPSPYAANASGSWNNNEIAVIIVQNYGTPPQLRRASTLIAIATCALAPCPSATLAAVCHDSTPLLPRPFPLCLSLQPVVDAIAGRGAGRDPLE